MSLERPLRILRSAAVILAAPVLFLALLEGGLRLIQFGHPAGFWIPVSGAQAVETNRDFGSRFFPSALVRAPEPIRLDDPKPAGVYRIFVIGGSAAMGFPEPAFSFARLLEVLLERRYPQTDFEVVNAAMTAINSHVALPIVRDSAQHEPDAFVLYLGNNEVVGPYGPGTVFGAGTANLTVLRWAIDLGGTRTGQAFRRLLDGFQDSSQQPATWRGMEMFVDKQISADDQRLDRVYSSFEDNLVSMAETARSANAQTVLSTVAVNLRDCPPFAPGDGPLFSQAESRADFERVRDEDKLRFRADSKINAKIRRVSERLSAQGVRLVDAEEAFAAESRAGAPGDEWLLEHVHLRFEGALKLAQLVADELAPGLPTAIRERASRGPAMTVDEAAQELAFTLWDRHRIDRQIHELMLRPPFTLQEGHAARVERRGRALNELAAEVDVEAALMAYEQALGGRPADHSLIRRHAELLSAAGQPEQAIQQWERLLEELPGRLDWALPRAAALRAAGRLDEAVAAYEAILREHAREAAAHFGLGAALQQMGSEAKAEAEYLRAIELDPGYAEAHTNLGLIRLDAGEAEAALARFDAALLAEPRFAPALNNRGLALVELGRAEEALEAFEAAVACDPGLAAAHFHLGSLLASRGAYEQAAPHLEEAFRRDPLSAEAAAGLGTVSASRGELEKAVELYEMAVSIQPSMAEAQFSLAKVLEMQGEAKAAIKRYQMAIEIRPDYVEAINNLGIALARQGELEAAAQTLEGAVRLRPDFEPARKNLAKIRAALTQQR